MFFDKIEGVNKVKFNISKNEKETIMHFKKSKYPAIYKIDLTDNILFIELIDFDVCSLLLKGKSISHIQYEKIIEAYEKYLSQVNIECFDEYALVHYKDVIKIMDMFKKYYGDL